jgi:hypothetical protein
MNVRLFLLLGFFAAALGLAAASPCPPGHRHSVSGATAHHAAGFEAQAGEDHQCHHNRPASARPLAMQTRTAPCPAVRVLAASPLPVSLAAQARPFVPVPLFALTRLRRDAGSAHDAAFARTGRLLI